MAATVVTSLLVFAALNVAAGFVLDAGWLDEEAGALTYGIDRLRPSYPDKSDEEIRRVVREVWTRPYRYEPFTQFREMSSTGAYVNVRPEGYRATGSPQPWPPSPDRPYVLAFGGSTLFGYGLADAEALPARLEVALAARCAEAPVVYNFGRSNYFSSQERILFQQLVGTGLRPRAAVFLDGLNEFAYPSDEPKFTARLRYLMEETNGQLLRRWIVGLPLARLVKAASGRDVTTRTDADDPEPLAERVIQRWLTNARMTESVANAFGVPLYFAWQPVPTYRAPESANPFLTQEGPGLPNAEAMNRGYSLLAALVSGDGDGLPRSPVIWLADDQRGADGVLYVDRAHYTAAFSDLLARRIADAIEPAACASSAGQSG